jgi:iron complex outermembrane receptor protein
MNNGTQNSELFSVDQSLREIVLHHRSKGVTQSGFWSVATAALVFVSWIFPGSTRAADTNSAPSVNEPVVTEKSADEKVIEEVVVTGSLIPQTKEETATPVTVISAADIQQRGFSDIAEALQRAAFSTGSVQGGQYNGGFTQGAKTDSMFGLDPSFTKYLIDGRPIADYPALYNGSENFVSINNIPTVFVDHLDILPGAQSSIYGSDAIAGVVNIVLKKNLSGPIADVRYGWTQDGGGKDRRIALADGFTVDGFNLMGGIQYEKTDPIWGYQRSMTRQYFPNGTTLQTAARDYLLLDASTGSQYFFEDPANCANVAAQFNNSVHVATRKPYGQYCGSVATGFNTLDNADESTQGYVRASYDFSDSLQVFVDALVGHDVTRFGGGGHFYDFYYEDPALAPGDVILAQHIFSPEETGGLDGTLNKDTNNSLRSTVGVKGEIGSSHWQYLADMTYTENKLTESINVLLAQPLATYFNNLFGPQIGFDDINGVGIYTPNYANFYKPVSTATWDSFETSVQSYSRTEESLARAQVTNPELFHLPGGDAGLAVEVEGGSQGWSYAPDPRIFNGDVYGLTATAGSGHRSRYAGTTELQLPIVSMLTANLSGRYDDYRVDGNGVDKFTYNLGLQFRPVEQFLLRGRYGTAFKAPTLADEFQGQSGSYTTLTDYYNCQKLGYSGATLGNCPASYYRSSVFSYTSGNTKLQPITAEVWDIGAIITPVPNLQISADFIHWEIHNEIQAQDTTRLLETEAACRLGELNITSPTCVAALAQVLRNPDGTINYVLDPKQNVSQENLGTVVLSLNYLLDAGRVGEFRFGGAYTDMISHDLQQFAGDPVVNLLDTPYYSTEFKTKENVSVTWSLRPVSTTLYVERYGRTPNYLAALEPAGYGTRGAGTLPSWTLCNFSASYQPISALTVTLALNNVFNKMPPMDASYPGSSGQPYDELDYNVYGRTFYLSAHYALNN